MKRTLAVAAVALALAAPLAADRADDDLQAVRRAVGTSEARPPAEAEPPPAAQPAAKSSELRWFRVRVVEKGTKQGRVSVNLPLPLVRSFGDAWPIGPRERGRRVTLGEVLRSLDSGQSLVEIEDADASVRIWID
jgi:hypothetical protein